MKSLFLAPHNDDETLFGTFTLLRLRPHVIICFRSYRMADPGYPGNRPVDYHTREFETEMAMKALGCEWTQLLFRDDQDGATHALKRWFELNKEWGSEPELVFAPAYEEEGHPQHNEVALAALDAFGDRVRSYLTYTRHGGRSKGHEVEYEPEWIALKLHALSCYKSQASHPATCAHFIDDPIREYVPEGEQWPTYEC